MKKLLTVASTVMMFALLIGNAYASKDNSAGPTLIPYKELLTRNREALARLSLGLSKAEALTIMGSFIAKTHNGMVANPLRVETFTRGDDVFEKLFYVTSAHHMFGTVNDKQVTPIVLKNGKVIGWGWDAANSISTSDKNSVGTELAP